MLQTRHSSSNHVLPPMLDDLNQCWVRCLRWSTFEAQRYSCYSETMARVPRVAQKKPGNRKEAASGPVAQRAGARSPRPSKASANQASELATFATALYQLVETLRAEHEEAAAEVGLTAPQAMILLMVSEPM